MTHLQLLTCLTGCKYLFVCLICLITIGSTEDIQKRVIVFGGNGFVGSELVLKLLDNGYHVTTVNRGNWYWDSPVRVKPKVSHHVTCDRADGLRLCWDLPHYLTKAGFFDAVIDLSTYDSDYMTYGLDILKNHTGFYIYISTDSIYQVCKKPEHGGPRRETDAVRPKSEAEQQRLQRSDEYGHRKLAAEEVLIKHRKERNGFPYVILRLPDILGQRDTTERFWQYQMWLQYYELIGKPLPIPKAIDGLKTNYIYLHDVVDAILKVLELNSTIHDEIFNLGFDEPITLQELLSHVADYMGTPGVEFKVDPSPAAYNVLPSVKFGEIDMKKAKERLGWSPTPWRDAVNAIVDFHAEAMGRFPLQRDSVARKLMNNVIDEENRVDFATKFTEDVRAIDEQLRLRDEL